MTESVVVEAHVAPRDLLGVSATLMLRNPVSVMLMAAGPLLWLLGLVSGSVVVGRLGETMIWLVVLVPAFAALVASYAAYRPGAAELYAPVRWEFAEEAVEIMQAQRCARADWGEFTGWRTVAGCYLLHTSASRYVVVPGRGVGDADREALEALFTKMLGRRRR
jgi:hypothetical protein